MKTPETEKSSAQRGSVKRLAVSLLAALLLFFARPAQAVERQTLHGHVPAAVAEYHLQPTGRLPAANQLHIVINLPPRDNETLSKLFREIYDPASTNFHRYLTPEEFTERFGPTEEDYQSIIDFAQTNGLTVESTTPSRSLVVVNGSVADIERVLHVKMLLYQHPTEARAFFAPDTEPSLDLKTTVQVIGGLNNFIIPHPYGSGKPVPFDRAAFPSNGNGGSGGGGLFLGSDFRHAYASGVTLNGAGEAIGLFEYGGYNLSDIQAYESLAGYSPTPLYNVFLNGITSNKAGGANTVEISGDIEMSLAMAPGVEDVVVYEGNSGVDSSGNTIFDEMAQPTQHEPLPHQISCSWGFSADSATSNKFVRFAVQGQSFFLASGDGGAFPTQSGGPSSNEGAEPNETQVGGTEMIMTGSGATWNAETVWNNPGEGNQFASSGGVFTGEPIPDYQLGISMTANKGSTQNRNAPDVAMVADNILIILTTFSTNGVPTTDVTWTSWGTSFASPLWAGFTALANQQATAEGKPRVGFINPTLYAIGKGTYYNYTNCFHDIAVGNNTWSNSPTLYPATKGYDLCTGWGSPEGQNLINAMVGFSGPVFVDFTFTGKPQTGAYDSPFETLAQGVSAVSNYGTIFIKTAASSSETMTISKPMTITADNGAATIGN